MERLRVSRVLVIIVSVVILTAGCSRGAAVARNTPPPTPTPTPRDLLNTAAQRFAQINSAHYQLQIAGNVYLDNQKTLALRGAEGDLARPDSATAKASVALAGANLTIDMIAIGQDEYITNFLTGAWERAPQGLSYNPAILFDAQNGIPGVLSKVDNVTLVGIETVDGIKAQHLRGTAPRAAVQTLTGTAFQGDAIDFDIWLAADTEDIHKVVLHDPGTGQGATPTTWTLLITNINKPVTITAPSQ